MRILALTILLALAFPLSSFAQRRGAARDKDSGARAGVERRVNVEPDVAVSLCLMSGDVIVRGWDKNEVQARSDQAGRIELRAAKTGLPGKGVEVLISDDTEGGSDLLHGCAASSDVELDVPRGATVNIKVLDGDVDISGVAEARVESLSGDVDARSVSRLADLSCLSGDISLSDSKGRARLRSESGFVEASNVSPLAAGDELQARSTSGDVRLERITHANVKGTTTSGNVRLSGPLVSRGLYEFSSHSGDVTLELPPDASFKINARIFFSGDIVTDFPVSVIVRPAVGGLEGTGADMSHTGKAKTKHSKELNQTSLVGVVGKGDAELKLTTFSGTVYLKKK